jgi:hypothetical protein
MSRGLVVTGILSGICAVVWPLRFPGALSLGLALCVLAAIAVVVREYLLGTPVFVWLLPVRRPRFLEKHAAPLMYAVCSLFALLLFLLIFTFLLLSAVEAWHAA